MIDANSTIPFTKEGFEELSQELKSLKEIERPKIIAAIAEARAHGDLSENAEYHAAREKQSFIEGRIMELEGYLSRATIVNSKMQPKDRVSFGAYVTVIDESTGEEKTFRVVGDLESDINKNKISINSPIGKTLLGKKINDVVEIKVPKGTIEYTILNIQY